MFHSPFIAMLLLVGGSFLLGHSAAANFVRYEDFGARGDGVTDDFEAIAKAHDFANQHGRLVQVRDDATYYIGGAARTIAIRTSTDFGKARFIIDDTKVEKHNAHVFEVGSDLKPVTLKGIDSLAAGQRRIDATLPGPCVVTAEDSSVKHFIRRGGNQNKGSSQTDTFLVDRRGLVNPDTPIIWDFKKLTSLVAMPVDESTLVLRGGIFTTMANSSDSTSYHARGILIRRSNVVVEGLQHHIKGEGAQGPPYSGFISISNCANVVVRDTVLTGRKTYYKIGSAGSRVPMGSYGISINRALNVALIRVTQSNDIMDNSRWGIIGTNFCKNLLYDECELSRFDAHQGVTNATIRNSTIGYMGVQLTGFGQFLIENSTVKGNRFINLRQDYGSTWNGDIVIRNCRFITRPGGTILSGSNDGRHDFGYTCFMPRRLVIDGLTIDDGKASKKGKGPAVFADFNPRYTKDDYRQDFPYMITRELVVRNVTTTSGTPLRLSDNPFMVKDVKVQGLD